MELYIERLEKIRAAKEKLENLKSSTPVQLAEKTITKPVVGAGAGAAIGAVAGGSLGVAGKLAGVMIAVNGGWILAPIGAVIGYSLGTAFPMIFLIYLGKKIRNEFPKGSSLIQFMRKQEEDQIFPIEMGLILMFIKVLMCGCEV